MLYSDPISHLVVVVVDVEVVVVVVVVVDVLENEYGLFYFINPVTEVKELFYYFFFNLTL